MSTARLTINATGPFADLEKFEKELLLHKGVYKTKKKKRVISIGVWNINNASNEFPTILKENYIFFMVTALRKFAIDILILFNSGIDKRVNWNGYNCFCFGNVVLLWNQAITLRPNILENNKVINIEEIKLVISLDNKSAKVINELSKIEQSIIMRKKQRYMLIGVFRSSLFSASNFNGNRSILDVEELNVFGKILNGYKIISTPYELNNFYLFNITKIVEASLGVRLVKVKSKITCKDISNILEGEEPKSILRLKKSFNWKILHGEFETISHIMSKIIDNQLSPIFAKYNGIWVDYRKEPYLGNSVPENIVFSYKTLLLDNPRKKYEYVKIPKGIDIGTFPKDVLNSVFHYEKGKNYETLRLENLLKQIKWKSNSSAANFDMYRIKDILKGMKKWFKTKGKKAIAGKRSYQFSIRNLLRRIIYSLNRGVNKQVMVSFFLLKDSKLLTASDTRMIAIAPTLLKIFEILIYKEVVEASDKIMAEDDGWRYQFGARLNSSTSKAMINVRDIVLKTHASGIITLDITKGYESVVFSKLKLAVQYFIGSRNLRLRFLLLAWVTFVQNLDILVSGEVIKKTQGIPMGLMLSPLFFIIYVNYLLRNVKSHIIDRLSMYIDDILYILHEKGTVTARTEGNITYPEIRDPGKEISAIVDALSKGNLMINFKKAKLVTSSKGIINNVTALYSGLEIGNSVKFLGREIILKGELLLSVDLDIDRGMFNLIRQVHEWVPLVIRLAIFNGGLEASSRFQALMFEISFECKRNLFNRAKVFYAPAFHNIMDIQLLFILGNYFRYSFNAIEIKDWVDVYPKGLSNDMHNFRMDRVKDCLSFDIPRIDNVMAENFDNWITYGLFESSWSKYGEDFWKVWKLFTKKVWIKFKTLMLFEYWKEIAGPNVKDTKSDSPACFSWNKLCYWLIAVDDKDNCEEISITKRFAILLDLAFMQEVDVNMKQIIIQFNNVIDEWFISLLKSEFTKECSFTDKVIKDINFNEIASELLTKIMLMEVIVRKRFNDFIRMKGFADVVFTMNNIWSEAALILEKDQADLEFELHQIKIGQKAIKKMIRSVRKNTIRVLLAIDSVYMDSNFKKASLTYVTSYLNVMQDLYKEQIDKQMKILEIVSFQLDEQDRFVIDQNIEYNYLQYKYNT